MGKVLVSTEALALAKDERGAKKQRGESSVQGEQKRRTAHEAAASIDKPKSNKSKVEKGSSPTGAVKKKGASKTKLAAVAAGLAGPQVGGQ